MHTPQPLQLSGMHDGDRALRLLQDVGDVAEGVEDRFVGADDAAGAAVDAQRRLDEERQLRLTADGLGRTALLARGAAGAVLGNDGERHRSPPSPHRSYSCISFRTSSRLPFGDELVVLPRLAKGEVGEVEQQEQHPDDRNVVRLDHDGEELLPPGHLFVHRWLTLL